MKNLLRYLAFVLMVGCACAQSNLPDCQGSDTTKWSNCTGYKRINEGGYSGEFKDGKMHGRGIFFSSNFDKYYGEFKNNVKEGQGVLYFREGGMYEGEFKNDKINGQGTKRYLGDEKYVGEWKDGKLHGQGTYSFISGIKYVGEFKNNKINGEGTMYSPLGGIVFQGIWDENLFVRSTTLQQATTPSVQQSNTPNPGFEILCRYRNISNPRHAQEICITERY